MAKRQIQPLAPRPPPRSINVAERWGVALGNQSGPWLQECMIRTLARLHPVDRLSILNLVQRHHGVVRRFELSRQVEQYPALQGRPAPVATTPAPPPMAKQALSQPAEAVHRERAAYPLPALVRAPVITTDALVLRHQARDAAMRQMTVLFQES